MWVLEVLRMTGASSMLQPGFPIPENPGESPWASKLTSSKQAHSDSESHYFGPLPVWPSADLYAVSALWNRIPG